MLSSILSLLSWLLDLFKPKSDVSQAHDDGVSQGIFQQQSKDQQAVLDDVQKAKAATDSVDRGLYSGISVTTNDGFRRD